jgi:isochorismate synthase
MINEVTNAAEACTSLKTDASIAKYIWEVAQNMGLPVAVWRLPESRQLKLVVAERALWLDSFPDLERLDGGFVMATFPGASDTKVCYLKGSLTLSWELGTGQVKLEVAHQAGSSKLTDEILTRAKSYQSEKGEGRSDNKLKPTGLEGKKERFQRIVQVGAEAVRSGKLFKVVLSRTKEFEIRENFSFTDAFLQLEAAYPSAFVSMVSLPEREEVWLGASPEILVEVKQHRVFQTVALAGTQSAKDDRGDVKPKFKVLWSEKEIEEQAIVSRYIIECFKRIRLREYVESGPKSSMAGNLYHLKSDFIVDLEAVNFPELGSVMLKLLHPTSAVCGMPKEDALSLIASLEGYERAFYSGFWGPVNVDQDTHLYVNLRCLSVHKQIMTLYAGAGITSDSDPEAEWKETELKCDTLLSVLDPELSFDYRS